MCNIYLGKFVKKIWEVRKEMSFAWKHLEKLGFIPLASELLVSVIV